MLDTHNPESLKELMGKVGNDTCRLQPKYSDGRIVSIEQK